MISIEGIIWILLIHWFADFVYQTDYWAKNKSKSNLVLATHVLVYSLLMLMAVYLSGMSIINSFIFFASTFLFHFWTDYISSRLSNKLAEKEDWHNFFVAIGVDQFLHYAQLFITYYILTRH
ncbi:hypothetical protein BH09PAT1_BH09PAT1_6530 [soil metagenome]